MRHRRTALVAIVGILLAGTLALTWHRIEERDCGAGVASVGQPAQPLLSPRLMKERPDPRRDALAGAVERMGPPFGEVLGGVDYYYEQWLHLYGVSGKGAGGVLAWTKRNAPVTMLDGDTLEPVWALRPDTRRVAWDASADSFLLLTLSADRPTEVLDFDLATGDRRWCARLATTNEDGDPVTTAFLRDGSVVVAAQDGSGDTALVRLSTHGDEQWQQDASGVDRADFVGSLGDLVVVGGREEFHLADGRYPPPSAADITAFSARSGQPVWRHSTEGGTVHVVGASDELLVLLERRADGVRLAALDDQGHEVWSVPLPASALQATLRNGVVLVKSQDRLTAHAASDGRRLWGFGIPATFTPYGFTLSMMPSLDAHRLLLPTTRDLRVLDVRTGKQRRLPMPTDGINTTYWPYQLLATDQLVGIVTNTGAIVARRTP
jgi:hypothetical protein